MLAVWYDLSDVKLAEALDDRGSFRRFCGFSRLDQTPERTAFVRFRKALSARGLDQDLFDNVTSQLKAKAVRVKMGTIVDATIIASASKSDEEARWVKHKRKPAVHGFKAHVGADAETASWRKSPSPLRTSMMARQAEKLSRIIPVKSSPTAPIGEKPFGRPSAPRAVRRASWRRKFGDATCSSH